MWYKIKESTFVGALNVWGCHSCVTPKWGPKLKKVGNHSYLSLHSNVFIWWNKMPVFTDPLISIGIKININNPPTRILLESLSRPFNAKGRSPILAVMNFASEMMAATSSRPSFLVFQFLSPILETRSEVILSLKRWDKKNVCLLFIGTDFKSIGKVF